MDKQLEIIKKMAPQQKRDILMQSYRFARSLKEAAIRQHHPDWTDERIAEVIKEAFMSIDEQLPTMTLEQIAAG